ncbi:hypothetical protein FRC17_007512, partial [Serendipita sp. 399]
MSSGLYVETTTGISDPTRRGFYSLEDAHSFSQSQQPHPGLLMMPYDQSQVSSYPSPFPMMSPEEIWSALSPQMQYNLSLSLLETNAAAAAAAAAAGSIATTSSPWTPPTPAAGPVPTETDLLPLFNYHRSSISPISTPSSSSTPLSSSITLTPPSLMTLSPSGSSSSATLSPSSGGAHLPHPNFIWDSFPLDNEDHYLKREALAQVMSAPWKRNHEMEPHESLLLTFMRLDTSTNRWTCCFHVGGGGAGAGAQQQPCGSSYKKKDQAKGHVRFHLQHFPFACLDVGP